MQVRALLAALSLVLAVLAGCGSDANYTSGRIEITGDLGAPVTISVAEAPNLESATSKVVTEGSGNEVHSGATVLFRATSFDSRTGEIIENYATGSVRLAAADSEGVGDLADIIVGSTEGSRILVERPGLVAGDSTAVEVVVVDILYTTARGDAADLPDPLPEGMPTIETADGGGPAITAGGGAIDSLHTVELVTGTGEQVLSDSTVAIQYVIADASGSVIDTTWNGTGAVSVDLSTVMEGLRDGLADQKVHSRVVVLIPSAEAAGDGDRVAIVDILAVMD